MGIYSKQWKPRAHYIKYLVDRIRISGFWVRAYSQLWITPGSLHKVFSRVDIRILGNGL